jgi:hypothetical protein
MLKTSGLISSNYIGSRGGRGPVDRGEVGQWVAGESETVDCREKGIHRGHSAGRRAGVGRGTWAQYGL